MALLGDAWRLVRARQGPFLAALLLVNVAFAGAMQWAGPQAEAALRAPLAHWSYEILTQAFGALLTAFALRLFLAPESRWWRLCRGARRRNERIGEWALPSPYFSTISSHFLPSTRV